MSKLKLKISDLKVESFKTDEKINAKGTVLGQETDNGGIPVCFTPNVYNTCTCPTNDYQCPSNSPFNTCLGDETCDDQYQCKDTLGASCCWTYGGQGCTQ